MIVDDHHLMMVVVVARLALPSALPLPSALVYCPAVDPVAVVADPVVADPVVADPAVADLAVADLAVAVAVAVDLVVDQSADVVAMD